MDLNKSTDSIKNEKGKANLINNKKCKHTSWKQEYRGDALKTILFLAETLEKNSIKQKVKKVG